MHDALHLINQRWSLLVSTTDAKRRLLEADMTVERMKLAEDDKVVSLREVQMAELAATGAKQEYERWSRTLGMHDVQIKDDQPARMVITSPINGEIAVANFTQGQLVYEGGPLFTVVDLTTVWVEVKVPERFVPKFREQETLEFVSSAFPSRVFRGKLQRIAAQVDPAARTLSHFYSVENPQRLLRIGMLVSVRPVEGRSSSL